MVRQENPFFSSFAPFDQINYLTKILLKKASVYKFESSTFFTLVKK